MPPPRRARRPACAAMIDERIAENALYRQGRPGRHGLADKHDTARLEAACARAIDAGTPSYKTICGILAGGTETHPQAAPGGPARSCAARSQTTRRLQHAFPRGQADHRIKHERGAVLGVRHPHAAELKSRPSFCQEAPRDPSASWNPEGQDCAAGLAYRCPPTIQLLCGAVRFQRNGPELWGRVETGQCLPAQPGRLGPALAACLQRD
jgi:hypothetical protein